MFLEDQFLPTGDIFDLDGTETLGLPDSGTDTESLTFSDINEIISISGDDSSSSSAFFGCCEDCPCKNFTDYLDDLNNRFGVFEEPLEEDSLCVSDEKIDLIVEQTDAKMKIAKCLKCKKKGRTCGKWKVKEQQNCECLRINFHKRKLQKTKTRTKKERQQSRDEKHKK
jgi:hypothetical protein